MWVWQSQAPAGTSKFTRVAGCEALAKLVRRCTAAPAAIAPIRTSRRVSMGFSFGGILSVARRFRYLNPDAAFGQVTGDVARLQASPGVRVMSVRKPQVIRHPGGWHQGAIRCVWSVVGNPV